MPIFEFYCSDCHTVFNFLSRRGATRRRPACPRCGRLRLERRPSVFAVSRGLDAPAAGGAPADEVAEFDDARMERAFEALAAEAEGLDENDPRAMGRMMRRFQDYTGLSLGAGVEEAIARMEAGEDPESIEEELGDALDADDPAGGDGPPGARLRALARRLRPARVDPELHEL